MDARSLGLFVLSLGAAGCASSGSDARPPTAVQVPRPFEVVDMDGARHDLDADLAAGKAVVLVWWQTWCASCKAETPELAAAARAHADHLSFIGVVPGTDDNVDDGEVREVARDLGLPYPNVRDRALALTGAFGVEGTPTIVVLEGSPAQVVWTGHRVPPDLGAFGRAARP
jgi:thiol-disulfide isomerase/thioredoxin